MQNRVDIRLFIFFTSFILLFFVSCNDSEQINDPIAKKGVIDLRNWNFEKDGNIALSGDWKFYWKELVNPNDTTQKPLPIESFISVPGSWENMGSYSAQGYATYSLEILLDSTHQWLKFHTEDAIQTSSVIYVNGEEMGSNGVVSSDENLIIPSDHIELFSFLSDQSKLKIIIHISNNSKGYSGGIISKLKLGLIKNIHKEKKSFFILRVFVYGCIFIFMISQIFFYFALSGNVRYLYLAINSFLILLYFSIDITRELAILNFSVNHTLLIIGWVFSLPVFIYYLKSIFKDLVHKFIPIIMLALAFITMIVYFFGLSIDFYRIIAIIELLYIIGISIIAVVKKLEHSKRFLFGLFILALSAINDLLIDLIDLQSVKIIYIGILQFLFIQVYAVSSHFTKAYKKNKNLTNELFSINRNLESLVIERTKEIDDQNIQLKSLIASKDQFFSIIAHDLRSPVSSMLSILNIFVENRERFDEKSTELMITEIQKSTNQTYNLLENLLNWARSQRGEIHYKPEKIELYQIIHSNIELIAIPIEKKKINLTEKTEKGLQCFADQSMLDLVIRNLLSNALKFTPIGGDISINCDEQDSMISITIKDSGIGIKKEDLSKLFDSGVKFTTWGIEGEKGSGLGLILCKEFIEKNNGTIKVESEEGKGSSFIFTIPKGKNN